MNIVFDSRMTSRSGWLASRTLPGAVACSGALRPDLSRRVPDASE
jgi:hypothetical protein